MPSPINYNYVDIRLYHLMRYLERTYSVTTTFRPALFAHDPENNSIVSITLSIGIHFKLIQDVNTVLETELLIGQLLALEGFSCEVNSQGNVQGTTVIWNPVYRKVNEYD